MTDALALAALVVTGAIVAATYPWGELPVEQIADGALSAGGAVLHAILAAADPQISLKP